MSWRNQKNVWKKKKKQQKKTVLHNACGLQKTGCPKNNNKEVSDRFTVFCISGADACQAKISTSQLNSLQTMWLVEMKGGLEIQNKTTPCTFFFLSYAQEWHTKWTHWTHFGFDSYWLHYWYYFVRVMSIWTEHMPLFSWNSIYFSCP